MLYILHVYIETYIYNYIIITQVMKHIFIMYMCTHTHTCALPSVAVISYDNGHFLKTTITE